MDVATKLIHYLINKKIQLTCCCLFILMFGMATNHGGGDSFICSRSQIKPTNVLIVTHTIKRPCAQSVAKLSLQLIKKSIQSRPSA